MLAATAPTSKFTGANTPFSSATLRLLATFAREVYYDTRQFKLGCHLLQRKASHNITVVREVHPRGKNNGVGNSKLLTQTAVLIVSAVFTTAAALPHLPDETARSCSPHTTYHLRRETENRGNTGENLFLTHSRPSAPSFKYL